MYYVHLLKAPNLSLLLSTQEFMPLYEKLKHLQAALVTYEPLTVGKRRAAFAENNPYEILDIRSDATAHAITAAYERAKKALSPKIVEQKLKDQGADAKTIKKRVKEATTTFMIVEEAYQVLKDPKKKKKLDARLQEEEASRDQGSVKAFENLYEYFLAQIPRPLFEMLRSSLNGISHKKQHWRVHSLKRNEKLMNARNRLLKYLNCLSVLSYLNLLMKPFIERWPKRAPNAPFTQ